MWCSPHAQLVELNQMMRSLGEDLTGELHELAPDESQQLIFAAVEHAAAGLGRRPHEWPEHLESIQQRDVIHEKCHYVLRGASLDDYATLEEEDDAGKHVELYLDPEVRQAFLSTSEGGVAHGDDHSWTATLNV